MEATPRFVRRVVIVLIDDSGQSTIAALRYAMSLLRPTMSRAVHFVIDSQQADRLRAAWPPDARVPLELVDCPGQSLPGCAAGLVRQEAELPGTQVTVVLPGAVSRRCMVARRARSPTS